MHSINSYHDIENNCKKNEFSKIIFAESPLLEVIPAINEFTKDIRVSCRKDNGAKDRRNLRELQHRECLLKRRKRGISRRLFEAKIGKDRFASPLGSRCLIMVRVNWWDKAARQCGTLSRGLRLNLRGGKSVLSRLLPGRRALSVSRIAGASPPGWESLRRYREGSNRKDDTSRYRCATHCPQTPN